MPHLSAFQLFCQRYLHLPSCRAYWKWIASWHWCVCLFVRTHTMFIHTSSTHTYNSSPPLPSPPLPSHFQVNLHFSLLALFSSLISPTGCVEDNGVVLPLIALTDCILVRVGVAAQLLQYLLTSPPAMEISDNSGIPCVCKCVGVWVCAVWVWEWDGEYGV